MKPYLKYTFRLAWRQKKDFVSLVILRLIDTATRLIQPYIYKLVVDTLTVGITAGIFSAGQIDYLIKAIIVWFVVAVVYNLVNGQSHFLTWRIGNVSSQWIHDSGYRRLLRLDYSKHTKKHSSKFAKIVDDADTAMWEMNNWWFGRFFPSMLGFTGMLIIAFSVSVPMTLVALAVIPFGLLLIFTMIRKCEDEQRNVNKLWTQKHEHLSDQVTNIITYKLNQDEDLFAKVQKGFSRRAHDAQMALNAKWRITEMLNPDVIARFAVMALGIWLVKEKAITLGTLFMFMGLMGEILTPLNMLGDILPQYSRRARHIEKLLDLEKEPDSVTDPARPKKLAGAMAAGGKGVAAGANASGTGAGVAGGIEFRDVSFSYGAGSAAPDDDDDDDYFDGESGNDGGVEEEKAAKKDNSFGLRHVSFVINPGEHVAFVGHSGAGKSTIMALVTRLVDPTSGKILLDGTDIREYRQADYRRLIGAVLQENSLYNETIAQNIAYGKHGASRREIMEAAKKAAAHWFIEKLPKGYDTMIGERGVRLSGGEKQRIAIARAILKNPRIVVLDEPTSALDSLTEAKVQKGLQVLIEGRTAITIAHRLSTVRNADRIFIVKGGEIMASGSHSELLRNYDEYREMVELQTGGFLDDKDEGAESAEDGVV
jgi:ATP-binding cassette, subfamily B, bacterial